MVVHIFNPNTLGFRGRQSSEFCLVYIMSSSKKKERLKLQSSISSLSLPSKKISATLNLSTWESEAGKTVSSHQPDLYSKFQQAGPHKETLYQKGKKMVHSKFMKNTYRSPRKAYYFYLLTLDCTITVPRPCAGSLVESCFTEITSTL